jgi:hypothetical protein
MIDDETKLSRLASMGCSELTEQIMHSAVAQGLGACCGSIDFEPNEGPGFKI